MTILTFPAGAVHVAGSGQVPAGDLQAVLDAIVSGQQYTHYQMQAASVWSVSHGLGRVPAVTVVDSAGEVVIGDIDRVDDDNLTISFTAAFSGTAYCA